MAKTHGLELIDLSKGKTGECDESAGSMQGVLCPHCSSWYSNRSALYVHMHSKHRDRDGSQTASGHNGKEASGDVTQGFNQDVTSQGVTQSVTKAVNRLPREPNFAFKEHICEICTAVFDRRKKLENHKKKHVVASQAEVNRCTVTSQEGGVSNSINQDGVSTPNSKAGVVPDSTGASQPVAECDSTVVNQHVGVSNPTDGVSDSSNKDGVSTPDSQGDKVVNSTVANQEGAVSDFTVPSQSGLTGCVSSSSAQAADNSEGANKSTDVDNNTSPNFTELNQVRE